MNGRATRIRVLGSRRQEGERAVSEKPVKVRIDDDGVWNAPVEIPPDVWAEVETLRNADWRVRDVLSEPPPPPDNVVTVGRLAEAWARRYGVGTATKRESAALTWVRSLLPK